MGVAPVLPGYQSSFCVHQLEQQGCKQSLSCSIKPPRIELNKKTSSLLALGVFMVVALPVVAIELPASRLTATGSDQLMLCILNIQLSQKRPFQH